MIAAGTRLYLKIGTTGTGGMGLNIPYTHSEDKPSPLLMSKTAVAFAHTGLMFLMARTPGGPIVKELKPGGMVGYADITQRAIVERGQPVYLYAGRAQPLGQPVIRTINSSSFIPSSSRSSSTRVSRPGIARSDSARARPQVGNAGQAIAASRAQAWIRSSPGPSILDTQRPQMPGWSAPMLSRSFPL